MRAASTGVCSCRPWRLHGDGECDDGRLQRRWHHPDRHRRGQRQPRHPVPPVGGPDARRDPRQFGDRADPGGGARYNDVNQTWVSCPGARQRPGRPRRRQRRRHVRQPGLRLLQRLRPEPRRRRQHAEPQRQLHPGAGGHRGRHLRVRARHADRRLTGRDVQRGRRRRQRLRRLGRRRPARRRRQRPHLRRAGQRPGPRGGRQRRRGRRGRERHRRRWHRRRPAGVLHRRQQRHRRRRRHLRRRLRHRQAHVRRPSRRHEHLDRRRGQRRSSG